MPKYFSNPEKELLNTYNKCLKFINVTKNEFIGFYNFSKRSSLILTKH